MKSDWVKKSPERYQNYPKDYNNYTANRLRVLIEFSEVYI